MKVDEGIHSHDLKWRKEDVAELSCSSDILRIRDGLGVALALAAPAAALPRLSHRARRLRDLPRAQPEPRRRLRGGTAGREVHQEERRTGRGRAAEGTDIFQFISEY